MCIIAAQSMGSAPLASDILANCWKENPHGAGYMFCDGGNVIIRKAFFTLEELEGSYREDHSRCGQSSPFVLHFRWATHGSKNELNTHPHPIITGNVALVHNGILKGVIIPKGEDISDTIAYIRQHLSWRTPKQLLGAKMRRRLGEEIGWHNKFVILRGDGELSIVNEREGEWADGVWYSNTTYRPQPPQLQLPSCGEMPSSLFWNDNDDEWAKFRRNRAALGLPGSTLPLEEQEDICEELWEELIELEEKEWDELTEEEWKRRRLLEEVLYEESAAEMEEANQLHREYTRYLMRDDAA